MTVCVRCAAASRALWSFLVFTALQEYILRERKYQHSSVLTLAISSVTTLVGGLFGGFRNRKAPLQAHLAVGALSCATIGTPASLRALFA